MSELKTFIEWLEHCRRINTKLYRFNLTEDQINEYRAIMERIKIYDTLGHFA